MTLDEIKERLPAISSALVETMLKDVFPMLEETGTALGCVWPSVSFVIGKTDGSEPAYKFTPGISAEDDLDGEEDEDE